MQSIDPSAVESQVAGRVPAWLVLPSSVRGIERCVLIAPAQIAHIRNRRPSWLEFCLRHIPEVLAVPDFIGQRVSGDRRRVEFVRLVGKPAEWLLVSVKFLDDRREAWVNSAHPIGAAYLTRRCRTGTMWKIVRGREDGKVTVAIPDEGI